MIRYTRIRSALTVATFCLIALILVAGSFIANSAYTATLIKTTESELRANAAYLAKIMETQVGDYSQYLSPYGQSISTRITLIDAQGIVQYDSVYPLDTLNNHLYREEVQKALQEGVATSRRHSTTENLPVVYVALRLDSNTDIAVLRVSRTLEQIRLHHAMYRRIFLPAAIILLLMSFGIMALVINTLTNPLTSIKRQAKSYEAGLYKAKACNKGPKELVELSSIMEQMAKQVDAQIKREQHAGKQLKTLLNSLEEGILLLDGQMHITIANERAKTMLDDPLLGKRLVEVIPKEAVISLVRRTLSQGTTESLILEHYDHIYGQTALLLGKDDTCILHLQSSAVKTDESVVSQVVLSIADRTNHRRLENMRKEFVANVSHELKTPITSIAGFSQALLKTRKDEEIEHFSSIINRQALNMQHIVEDLLLLSSLDQQSLAHQKIWVDPSQLIEDTVQACSYRFREKQTSLQVNLENPHHLQVYVNPMLICQALTNLLINALTYNKQSKPVDLSLTVHQTQLICNVTDRGIGIPKEAQQRIFERFYRVDAARSRNEGGTGLGLSIVKHIAAVHQGSIEVKSMVGEGSTFSLTIPIGDVYLSQMKTFSDALYTSGK